MTNCFGLLKKARLREREREDGEEREGGKREVVRA